MHENRPVVASCDLLCPRSCRVILLTVMAAAADRFTIAANYLFAELSIQTPQMEKSHDQVQNRRPRIVGRRIG
jgi:hypothetical protein